MRVAIRNFLWADRTGSPEPAYSEEDVETKVGEVFRHVYRAYPRLPSPWYGAQ